MNVKLKQSMVGDRITYRPHQIVECSDRQGQRWIDRDMAVAAPKNAVPDVKFVDAPPKDWVPRRKRTPETATKPVADTPESAGVAPTCAGTTRSGNPCKKRPIGDSAFCSSAHQEGAQVEE